jgi:hypothetical protein
MSKLIDQITRGEAKVAYQTYTIQHGIESIQVQVPVTSVKVFEERFASFKTKQKTAILQLVEQVGGKVRAPREHS